MNTGSDPTKETIHAKIIELAAELGVNASPIRHDELIPVRAGLDSMALMELILWYETHFELSIPQADLNIETLGTIDSMAAYVEQRQRGKRC